MPNMAPYICVSERTTKPGQLVKDRIYWIDLDTKYTDSDEDTFAHVYKDKDRSQLVGNLNLNHFIIYFPASESRFPLLSHINSKTGLLLVDILDYLKPFSWPADPIDYSFLRDIIRDAIKDKECNKPENLYKEYLLTSIAEVDSKGNEILGYTIVSREDLEEPCIVQSNPTDYFD